jgi:hypothetical protein
MVWISRIQVRCIWEADERSCLSNLHCPFAGLKSFSTLIGLWISICTLLGFLFILFALFIQVQVPSSGSETIECGVCQHPFLVSAHWFLQRFLIIWGAYFLRMVLACLGPSSGVKCLFTLVQVSAVKLNCQTLYIAILFLRFTWLFVVVIFCLCEFLRVCNLTVHDCNKIMDYLWLWSSSKLSKLGSWVVNLTPKARVLYGRGGPIGPILIRGLVMAWRWKKL